MTRLYFVRLRRLTREALRIGAFTAELEKARAAAVPTFTHFAASSFDLPIPFLIVTLGVLRPHAWNLFAAGSLIAIAVAGALTIFIPGLYPWGSN
ncbi:MAG: hypothetical protein M1336_02905 [Deltaproteobacteria bacterium]|nr:hypothetical protein [Deltaproteobacteria bacterium]